MARSEAPAGRSASRSAEESSPRPPAAGLLATGRPSHPHTTRPRVERGLATRRYCYAKDLTRPIRWPSGSARRRRHRRELEARLGTGGIALERLSCATSEIPAMPAPTTSTSGRSRGSTSSPTGARAGAHHPAARSLGSPLPVRCSRRPPKRHFVRALAPREPRSRRGEGLTADYELRPGEDRFHAQLADGCFHITPGTAEESTANQPKATSPFPARAEQ